MKSPKVAVLSLVGVSELRLYFQPSTLAFILVLDIMHGEYVCVSMFSSLALPGRYYGGATAA